MLSVARRIGRPDALLGQPGPWNAEQKSALEPSETGSQS